MTKHICIDIETLDTAPTAVILSIGACVFHEHQGIVDTFYVAPTVKDQLSCGRTISDSTLEWWLAGNATLEKGFEISFYAALKSFSEFVSNHLSDGSTVWSNGTDFDISILSTAFAHSLAPQCLPVWPYNSVRDCRTLFKIYGKSTDITNLVPHDALYDAIYEAEQIMHIYKEKIGSIK